MSRLKRPLVWQIHLGVRTQKRTVFLFFLAGDTKALRALAPKTLLHNYFKREVINVTFPWIVAGDGALPQISQVLDLGFVAFLACKYNFDC